MFNRLIVFSFCLSVMGLFASSFALADFRQSVKVVGSSTVFPFAAFVAEKYHRKTDLSSPVVESTGTGGGFKLFCAGIGENHPDIVTASRRMALTEIRSCTQNNIRKITEVQIGWDGITLVKSKQVESFNLTRRQLFMALARQLPKNGKLVKNTAKLWSDIGPGLPARPILVYGPPPTSGTRDVFVKEVMNVGCRGIAYLDALDQPERETACGQLREDGLYVEAGEDDDLIVRRLTANPNAIGIMGYNAVERRSNLIDTMPVEGINATFETIRDELYPLTRPLYLYVKNEHQIALSQIEVYLDEFISSDAIGEDGYLLDKGLIPLKDDEGNFVEAQKLQLTY